MPPLRGVTREVKSTLGGSVKSNAIALLGAAIAYLVISAVEKTSK